MKDFNLPSKNESVYRRTGVSAKTSPALRCSDTPTRLLLAILAFTALFLTSCKREPADAKPPDVDYYTCTMHPSVKKQHPTDKCPICSMDLTPVKKKEVTAPERPSIETSHVRNTPDTPPSTLHAQHGVGAVRESEAQPAEFTVP